MLRVLLFLISFSVGVSAQERPTPVLVDEFGQITCEDLLARQDYFLSELSNNPQDIGYAVIYDSGQDPKGLAKLLNAGIYTRRFDRSRFKIALAKGSDGSVNGQFWRVLPGASLPDFEPVSEPPTDPSKPMLFGADFSENICPTFSPDLFVKLVNENPGAHGRVVIVGPNWSSRKAAARVELEMLERANLRRNKIKFYYIHRPKLSFIEMEYWYIPSPKK
jgi:hypothetical protein